MNVIAVMSDTFRADHINAYGLPAPWSRPGHEHQPFVDTPSLDYLVSQSALFERFYVGSYPTIPCRNDLFTGRFSFPTVGWEPLRPNDVILSELLAEHGYTTSIIFDTPPLHNDDYNFTRGFSGWEWVRGQHRDRWVTDPLPVTTPSEGYKIKSVGGLQLYLLNATRRQYERDWMCAKTLNTAMDWLEKNRQQENFLLWVDMWDPHDPFDAPPWDLQRYQDPDYQGDQIIYPRYGRPDYMSDAEINDVRARYAAKVSLVDRWIGLFLQKIKALGLDENTLFVFLTDHGHLFAEHDLQGKPTGPLGMLYEPTTRIPLLIRHPQGIGRGQRISTIAQHADILPTLFDILGLPIPPSATGKSLWPNIQGDPTPVHSYAFSGRYSRQVNILSAGDRGRGAASFDGWVGAEMATSEPLTVTTVDWTLICPPHDGNPPELYHLTTDPNQTENVIRNHMDVARNLHAALMRFLEENHAEPDRLTSYQWPAVGIPSGGTTGLDPSTELAVIDIKGRPYAFLTETEAIRMIPDQEPSSKVIQRLTLSQLKNTEPNAMVCIGDQYYWAQDLLRV